MGNPLKPAHSRGLRLHSALSLAVLAIVGNGCSNNTRSGVSFKFDRPEVVELACIDKNSEQALPMRCCSPDADDEPLGEEGSEYLVPVLEGTTVWEACVGSEPVLHALVSQSVRGEVAAVDLVTGKVLDSDQRIPGFTFVDVGGLPTAIVVPLERPTPGYQPEKVEGPPWTYVASGADNAVRALATCRFRTGEPCGPEKSGASIIQSSKVELFLPATPYDMFIGPDEALWVSLPEEGLLARIQVAPRGAAPSDSDDDPLLDDPFLMAPGGQVPADPEYFRVPVPSSFELGEPQSEVPAYLSSCGLGYEYRPGEATLPVAPRAPGEGSVSPAQMRYDRESGLVFITDLNLPVLHVFSLSSEGALVTRGSIPVGVPLTNIALSPYVPAVAPDLFPPPADAEPVEPNTDQKRYLYGLDTNGTLLAFELKTSETGASVVPIKAPVPDRYQDRLLMLTRSAVGAALEVVDTRLTSPEPCGIGAGDQEVHPDGQTSIVSQLQTQLNAANKALEQARKGGDQADIHDKTIARNKAQRRFEIARDAGPKQLRGVFLFVATMAGEINVFDILDLDVRCRAETSCNPATVPGEGHPLLEGSGDVQSGTSPQALAVQRNAPRLQLGQEPTVQVSSTSAFEIPMCGAQYVGADEPTVTVGMGAGATEEPLICLIGDPWAQRDQTWTAQVDAAIPGLQMSGAVLEENKDADGAVIEDQLIVRAPAGLSLCGRGAQQGRDDVVVILGGTPVNPVSDCPAFTTGSQPRLKILEAHDDHLVVRALGVSEGNTETVAELDDNILNLPPFLQSARNEARKEAADEVDRLLDCFPAFVTFEVRTGNTLVREPCPEEGECDPNRLPGVRVEPNVPYVAPTAREDLRIEPNYLVTGNVSGYLHRTIVGPDGTCVDDPAKDPRYRARTKVGEFFENTQLGFKLSPQAGTVANITTSQGAVVLRATIVSNSLPSARPTSIRFFPYTNELFLVDSATQGLRRLDLSPFGPDPSAIYR